MKRVNSVEILLIIYLRIQKYTNISKNSPIICKIEIKNFCKCITEWTNMLLSEEISKDILIKKSLVKDNALKHKTLFSANY